MIVEPLNMLKEDEADIWGEIVQRAKEKCLMAKEDCRSMTSWEIASLCELVIIMLN